MYELLGIPKHELRPAGLIEGHRRPSASQALLPGTVARAVSNGMPFLSAFDDEAWDYVAADWELNQYKDRKAILKEHGREEEKRKALYSENDEQGSQFQSEMSRLRKRWAADHKHWKRSWQGGGQHRRYNLVLDFEFLSAEAPKIRRHVVYVYHRNSAVLRRRVRERMVELAKNDGFEPETLGSRSVAHAMFATPLFGELAIFCDVAELEARRKWKSEINICGWL